jgi:hypothetical protein
MDGPLEIDRLRQACGALLDRHESLRTTVQRRDRQLLQSVHRCEPAQLAFVDFSAEPNPEATAIHALQSELHTRIDPADLPVRASLWKTGLLQHIFCLNVHHMASDAWSGWIQMRDLQALYESGGETKPSLPLSVLQYAEFTARQEEYFHGPRFAGDREYWLKHLAGAEFDSIPLGPPGSSERVTARSRIRIDAHRTESLKKLARSCKATLFGLMLSCYFISLRRITGTRNLSVASVFANRVRPDIQNSVGFIANLIILRSVIEPGVTFRSVLDSIQLELREAFVHQECPLHLLPPDTTARGGRRADETVFQMLPQELSSRRMGEVELTLLAPEAIERRFDFEVTVLQEQEELALIVFWNKGRLAEAWVNNFLQEFISTMSMIFCDPGQQLKPAAISKPQTSNIQL